MAGSKDVKYLETCIKRDKVTKHQAQNEMGLGKGRKGKRGKGKKSGKKAY